MPSRSRSSSPSPKKKSESKKSVKSQSKRVSANPSPSSSSSSSSSSRSRSPPRGKRKRSRSNGAKSHTSPKREKEGKRVRSGSREGARQKQDGEIAKREGKGDLKRESKGNTKRESKRELSPLIPGGRRWDDDSVKKENELGGWGGDKDKDKPDSKPAVEKLKPDFATSGALEEERNTVNGINLNYTEPPDARNPDAKWRLYVFKGEKQLDPLAIHRQSAYVVGRERKVAHLPIDHPSCSKQHSVIQFRIKRITPATADEEAVTAIRPYIIDLNSTNGTILNGKKIDPAKYYELLEEDVVKFGHSTREYVLIKAETQTGPTTLD